MRFYLILAITSLYLSGCATVARGTHTKMVVSTQPDAASVITDKETNSSKKARKKTEGLEPVYYGCPATPCEFKVPRRSEFIMTITKNGFEDVEIGVDSGISKESLKANLAGGVGTGAAAGLTVGVLGTAFSVGAGASATAGITAAAAVALPIVAVSTIVDGTSGALLNVRPNPVVISLPPTGTEFLPHPKVQEIRDKRAAKAEKARRKS